MELSSVFIMTSLTIVKTSFRAFDNEESNEVALLIVSGSRIYSALISTTDDDESDIEYLEAYYEP